MKQKTDVVRILPAGMPTSRQENIYVNYYPEIVENSLSQTKRVYCVKRKGLSETYIDASASASGEARGIYYWAATDRTYIVYGNTVWDYTGSTLSSRKTLVGSTGHVGFTECVYGLKKYLFFCDGTDGYLIDKDTPSTVVTIDNTMVEQLVITNAGTGYTNGTYSLGFSGGGGSGAAGTYTVVGNIVTSITITNKGSGYTSAPAVSFPSGGGSGAAATAFLSTFPVPHIPTPVFMDGYLFVAKKDTSEVYNSLLGDFTAWQSSQYITVSQFAGDVTGLTKQQNYILCFKEDSVEYVYNAGNTTGSPLARSTQAITQYGCNQRATISSLEDDILFVGKSVGGGFGVWKINGFKETKVSTEYVDRYLNETFGLFGNSALDPDRLVAAVARIDGHSFYVISDRTDSVNAWSLVYDPMEKFWSHWNSKDLTSDTKGFIGKYVTTRFDKAHFMGTDKKVYRFAEDSVAGSFNDGGEVYYSIYNSPVIDMDNYSRKRWRSLEIIGDLADVDSYLYINYLDNNTLVEPGWRINMKNTEARNLHNLGMSKARIWQIKHTQDLPSKFENIEVFYTQGTS